MTRGEIFSERFASDDEVDAILYDEAESYESEMHPEASEYLMGRRKLLGPIADINHPEFGRENLPSEIFGICYRVKEEIINRLDPQTLKTTPIHSYSVSEYIFDHENNLVDF